ncbi:kelch-like protein 5 [Limulus polyphemus]|uniref:Kelch-like protein diablo n=1 Tax=Limulus polyphemus TaxID=6850 RepID=A0ABM1BPC8_LIMPO|nr:kelch-like protein 5 [Limulus polyphemus]
MTEDQVSTSSSLSSLSSRRSYMGENDVVKHAITSLGKMKVFFSQNMLTDVTLVVGDRRIPAHRLVLSSASDYFAAMFTNNLREAVEQEVVLHNVDPDALSCLIEYCYTGTIELHENTAEVLLSTASLLQLHEVVRFCSGFMIHQLHPSNCIGIHLFAESQGCIELQKTAYNYIMENFTEVIHNQEFILLPSEELHELLLSDDINVPSEEIVFHSLITWLNHDVSNRKKHLGKLLGAVRLPLLAPQFIADHVEENSLLRSDRMCQDLIMEALKYHVLPERRSQLQTPRTKPRKSTVGALYIVGGMEYCKGTSSIEMYNFRTNVWTRVGAMNGRRLQFGAAVIDNKLFIVGGRDGLKTLNTVECYDPKTQTWSSMSSMSTHRHGLGVAVLEGPLYAVGGHDGWSYLNTVERWDPQTRQWSYVAPMNTQRSTAGVAVLNNRLYVVGGRDGSSCLRSVECFDPHTNKWTQCASMSKCRGGVGVGVINGYLFALGGHDAPAVNPSASRFQCVERYDPKTDVWTAVSPMSIGRDAIGVSVLGDKLFAIGGYDGQAYLNLVETYDPQTNEWSKVQHLATGRAGMCVVVIKSDL